MSKRKKKKGFKIFIFLIVVLLGIGGFLCLNLYNEYITAPVPNIEGVSISDDNIISVNFSILENKKHKDIYCLFKNSEELPNVDDQNWVKSKNNSCTYNLDDNIYYAFLKNHDDVIISVPNVNTMGKLVKFEANKNTIYLALDTSYTPTLTIESVGYINKDVVWKSEDESKVTVSVDGKITAKEKGSVKVTATLEDKTITFDVLATDLITKRPKTYNRSKPYLSCGKYTKEENDLLDKILLDRVSEVGYKTRASAVEAARFLALEFPYKIRYFSENGRVALNGVDGEGRYYHEGLYLHTSRYEKITKSANGPKTWGCQMYSNPSKGMRANGLDCSGFISWAMLNGGWDVKDVGAGLAPHLDMTDYGVRTKLDATSINSGKIKVGDLLSGKGSDGGHIAMIVGEDSANYYVAESLWVPPNVAVVILPYSKKTINKSFYWVMLMDSYYKEDGKLTKLWY